MLLNSLCRCGGISSFLDVERLLIYATCTESRTRPVWSYFPPRLMGLLLSGHYHYHIMCTTGKLCIALGCWQLDTVCYIQRTITLIQYFNTVGYWLMRVFIQPKSLIPLILLNRHVYFIHCCEHDLICVSEMLKDISKYSQTRLLVY